MGLIRGIMGQSWMEIMHSSILTLCPLCCQQLLSLLPVNHMCYVGDCTCMYKSFIT